MCRECLARRRPWAEHVVSPQTIMAVAMNKDTLPIHPNWPSQLAHILEVSFQYEWRHRPWKPTPEPPFCHMNALMATSASTKVS